MNIHKALKHGSYLFIHSFSKYLLRPTIISEIAQGTADTQANKIQNTPVNDLSPDITSGSPGPC